MTLNIEKNKWSNRAYESFDGFINKFWNKDLGMFNNHFPNPDNKKNLMFHYWWYAHAIDSLVDAYNRTGDEKIAEIIQEKYEGLILRNGGQPINLLYDDMEWLAIALLRAYDATNRVEYIQTVRVLWEDIKTGWNNEMGGGIGWHKEKIYYKNTPANAPAIILATRLYQTFGKEEDLEWAKKIFEWQDKNLVDQETGFVYDGLNVEKDGEIDDTPYTYCQGVYIGACVELYRITNDYEYIKKALLTSEKAIEIFTNDESGVFRSEGMGDGGLFKGIMARYMSELILEFPEETVKLHDSLKENAEKLWKVGRDENTNILNDDWGKEPDLINGVSLSVQLSGLMLFESLALLERENV